MLKNLALLHTPPHPNRTSIRHQGHADYVASLAICMDRLALDADWHFDRVGLTVANAFTFRTQSVAKDAMLDSGFEIVMSSALPCSKEQAASLIVLSFERDDERHRPSQVR